MKSRTIPFACLAIISLLTFGVFAQGPRTVGSVDLTQYSGRWYEIARYPNRFQKKCIGDTTADYKLLPNGRIEVINQCLKSDGTKMFAKGEARIVDKQTNAKLEVRFAPRSLGFLPFVWGDYWIIELGQNYEYSVVGDSGRKYFWILARKPRLDETTVADILGRAALNGFDPAKVIRTPQGKGE